VSAYSRAPLADLDAAAYFATDFYEGAAHLVATLLDDPARSFADVFASEPRFVADAVTVHPHAAVEGAETWLHRSAYFDGKEEYWYAFAGRPDASLEAPSGGSSAVAPRESLGDRAASGLLTGKASSYGSTAGWEGAATVALPVEAGVAVDGDAPATVLVCADRCVALPVVDSCPCYVGTADERVANLSHEAWRLVTDDPLEEGLIQVQVYLSPISVPSGPTPTG
jgi:hypothetical protein